jgi:hypothetical protein
MADPQELPDPADTRHRGRRWLVIAAALVSTAELLHAVLSSITVGSIYPVAAFRFVAITALAIFVVVSRSNWGRWILVALGGVWALGYAAQAVSRLSFDLGVIAAVLAAGVALLVTKPVSAHLGKRAA